MVKIAREDFDTILSALIYLPSFASPHTTKVLGCHYREQKIWKSLSAASVINEISPLHHVCENPQASNQRAGNRSAARCLDSLGVFSRSGYPCERTPLMGVLTLTGYQGNSVQEPCREQHGF